jgi:triosephosphate isomerase
MKTIIANWKMNVGVRESVALARATLLTLRGRKQIPELVICPPLVALSETRKVVAHSAVSLGAQNVFWKDAGAFTGEVSGRMLTELGVSHVIIGHSERRAHLGETDAMVNLKVLHALEVGLIPIVCVGETRDQRNGGRALEVVREQVLAAFKSARLRSNDRLYVAYEPVWAIGTGEACTVDNALETHAMIRDMLAKQFSGDQLKVLYGGSVDGENAYGFLREREVDGVLVGGASVKINQFKDVVAAASEVLEAQHD